MLASGKQPTRLRPPSYRRPRLGLALGGGGARGYAHIGVLRVLEREGIPIDYLAGTSMGGLVAAGYATGMTPDQLQAEALAMRTWRLLDLSLSSMGLLEGKRLRQLLVRIFGEREFADTRIPLRLTAVDLDKGEELTLGEGSLVDALRATVSVPGVFCPAVWRGRLLVDGGVTNNVPADMARVSPLLGTMIRSVAIMQAEILRHRLASAHPDLVIRPGIGPINIEDFDRAAEVIPTGQAAAELALPRIRQLLGKRLFWGS
jgi:NTE family protein